MNCFDEVQCEETPEAQLYFDMEEMAFMQEWMEARQRRAQAQEELDKISEESVDEILAAGLDF